MSDLLAQGGVHTDGTTCLWRMNGLAVSAFEPIANPGGTW